MDLPKNITQIGEADAKCKIYVEDYVVSFLKQLNPLARDKTMAAALYGRRETEEDRTYLFVYGAGKLDFIQREIRHLSQAQKQEIERIRKQYFKEYEFLGYRILDGEMVEGFHICEQEICRYISGYAQFYEKNEAMLSYMLESRQEEAAPESVDSEKYDMVRDRQDRRRARYVEQQKRLAKEQKEKDAAKKTDRRLRGFQGAAAAAFLLLCGLGLAMNSAFLEGTDFSLEHWRKEFSEQKLPDETAVSATDVQVDTIRAQDKLSEAVQIENNQAKPGSADAEKETVLGETIPRESEDADPQEPDDPSLPGPDPSSQEGAAGEDLAPEEAQEQPGIQEQEVPEISDAEPPKQQEPVTYIVCKGDTLTGISIRTYGNEQYIKQICSLNDIENPDEIKIGQKILLP